MEYPGVSWQAKVLYGRLALFMGKPRPGAHCNPSLETIAKAMGGVSVDTVERRLKELIKHKFIRRLRRGRRPAEIVFLRHACLDSDSAGLQTQNSKSAESRNQQKATTPQSCTSNFASSPAQFRNSAALIPQLCGPPNKKNNQENHQENSGEAEEYRDRFIAACASMLSLQDADPQHVDRIIAAAMSYSIPAAEAGLTFGLLMRELRMKGKPEKYVVAAFAGRCNEMAQRQPNTRNDLVPRIGGF